MLLLVYLQQHVGKPTTTCCCWFTSNNMLVNQQQHVVVGLPPTTHVGKPTTTCCVGGLPTYTTQNTSNTTYHWCVVYVVTFRLSYYSDQRGAHFPSRFVRARACTPKQKNAGRRRNTSAVIGLDVITP